MRTEKPFEITGTVVLPDHIHFIWTLPSNDSNYSQRVSRLKVLFTRTLLEKRPTPVNISVSRRKHRESNVWQRRFWEHTIKDELDLEKHLVIVDARLLRGASTSEPDVRLSPHHGS